MIVDSHQHFWQVGRFDYPWMSPELGVLYRDYLPLHLEPLLKKSGVAKTVLVQASNSLAETHWLLSRADSNPFITGVVGWVDLTAPGIGGELDESEPAEDWLVLPSVLRGLQSLSDYGVSYDLLVHTCHLKHARRVAESYPKLRLVIDHMAKPPIASGEVREWAQEIKAIARYPNVHCKLSGLVTEANPASWRPEDLQPFVERAIDYFGPERMMFGSDWPVCLLAASYDQVLDSVHQLLAGLSETERNAVLGENARTFYRLQLVASTVKVEHG